ncbi:MAG: hypothetical protein Q4G35_13895 [Propionibacteriaceae bacterium]|nr:hypothetical protein [Propionibacteriaceae bacterium]
MAGQRPDLAIACREPSLARFEEVGFPPTDGLLADLLPPRSLSRLAQEASTDGERAAAREQAKRILGSLALYYLPDPDEISQALGGTPPQLNL